MPCLARHGLNVTPLPSVRHFIYELTFLLRNVLQCVIPDNATIPQRYPLYFNVFALEMRHRHSAPAMFSGVPVFIPVGALWFAALFLEMKSIIAKPKPGCHALEFIQDSM